MNSTQFRCDNCKKTCNFNTDSNTSIIEFDPTNSLIVFSKNKKQDKPKCEYDNSGNNSLCYTCVDNEAQLLDKKLNYMYTTEYKTYKKYITEHIHDKPIKIKKESINSLTDKLNDCCKQKVKLNSLVTRSNALKQELISLKKREKDYYQIRNAYDGELCKLHEAMSSIHNNTKHNQYECNFLSHYNVYDDILNISVPDFTKERKFAFSINGVRLYYTCDWENINFILGEIALILDYIIRQLSHFKSNLSLLTLGKKSLIKNHIINERYPLYNTTHKNTSISQLARALTSTFSDKNDEFDDGLKNLLQLLNDVMTYYGKKNPKFFRIKDDKLVFFNNKEYPIMYSMAKSHNSWVRALKMFAYNLKLLCAIFVIHF